MHGLKALALLFVTAFANGSAQEPTGQICVAPAAPPALGQKSLSNPTGENRIRRYTIQIDHFSPTVVDSKHSTLISNIPLRGIHWVRVRGDGKVVESFKFTFLEFSSTRLCLFFNSLYESWNLWDSKQPHPWCKCSE
jgi:hypothetical protein